MLLSMAHAGVWTWHRVVRFKPVDCPGVRVFLVNLKCTSVSSYLNVGGLDTGASTFQVYE